MEKEIIFREECIPEVGVYDQMYPLAESPLLLSPGPALIAAISAALLASGEMEGKSITAVRQVSGPGLWKKTGLTDLMRGKG